jgi:phosphoribosylformylglycinamidine synthase
MPSSKKYRVAVIRQEGSNGDREMLSAFHSAGFEAWDVNMRDLLDKSISLDIFKGIVFCGGFSYADVNDSAKGWAGVIKFNQDLLIQFNRFRDRDDTFSLGVCNGCQLMALLGWVPFPENKSIDQTKQARFIHNISGRYESRWCAVKILESPAVLLKGMTDSILGIPN